MQKSLAAAVVLGAVIIAIALVYHGRQLSAVSSRLAAMEKRTSDLDKRMGQFSADLPGLIAQAGNDAGRQAVHGMVDEAVQIPLNWLKPAMGSGSSNALRQVLANAASNGLPEIPFVRFDIKEPVVKIEILPSLKEVPAIPWFPLEKTRQNAPAPAEQ